MVRRFAPCCDAPKLIAGDYVRNEDGTFDIELKCESCDGRMFLERAYQSGTHVADRYDNEGDVLEPAHEITVNEVEMSYADGYTGPDTRRFEVRISEQ